MTGRTGVVIIGADTHKDGHCLAAITGLGERLGCRRFPADRGGYAAAVSWACSLGGRPVMAVEGSGSYGAGLCRHALSCGIEAVEYSPAKRARGRGERKDDERDAFRIAYGALAGDGVFPVRDPEGALKGLAALKGAYDGAVKARTAALNSLDALVVGLPEGMRAQLRHLGGMARAAACASYRVKDALSLSGSLRTALRSTARRIRALDSEAQGLAQAIDALTSALAPRTRGLLGIGPQTAAALILAAGANPARMGSEASFAMLCGASPIPASSGKTSRHRLNRGGDRRANAALHHVAITRMRHDGRTRDFIAKKTAEGKGRAEARRCLKRYIARDAFGALVADLGAVGLLPPPGTLP